LEKWQSHLVGKGGLEPPCIAAPDPKSGPSASSGTPPQVLYHSILLSLSQALLTISQNHDNIPRISMYYKSLGINKAGAAFEEIN
jgi:hypothetical protein